MKDFAADQKFENLYMGNQPRLIAYAQRFVDTREAALDIVQDAFIKIWERYRTLDEEETRRLLFRMVRNSCLNYIKHQKFTDSTINPAIESTAGQELLYNFNFSYRSTEEDYLLKECDREVVAILSSLSEKCRRVFELRIYEGLKNREIAERLGISIKTVEKHIKKALSTFDESVKSDSSVLFKMLVLLWIAHL